MSRSTLGQRKVVGSSLFQLCVTHRGDPGWEGWDINETVYRVYTLFQSISELQVDRKGKFKSSFSVKGRRL